MRTFKVEVCQHELCEVKTDVLGYDWRKTRPSCCSREIVLNCDLQDTCKESTSLSFCLFVDQKKRINEMKDSAGVVSVLLCATCKGNHMTALRS